MSTRCTLHFHYGSQPSPAAIVYRHSDGYPEAVLPDLERFVEDVGKQTKDTRFDDASYLAAKYVVWQAHENAVTFNWETNKLVPTEPLNFLGVGIVLSDPSDIEHRYHLYCDGTPTIKHEEV